MTELTTPPGSTFTMHDFPLQCGLVLPEVNLVYQTYGTLNENRSNAILYPTSYGAQHPDIEWLIGPDQILDPTQYFIVIPNMLGNGLSTSPGNDSQLKSISTAWHFTHVDNVRLQRTMLREVFGIEKLALAYGWSMGGQQALHWAALNPESVERVAAVCTSARTSVHNHVFLEGLKSTLRTDPAWNGHSFDAFPERGLKAFGRVYAGWALSQSFYREELYLKLGYESLEAFLIGDWEASFLRRDPSNLLAMIETWQASDISRNDLYQGDFPRALQAIQARTFLIPSQTDLYFPPKDNQLEIPHLREGELRIIPSIWGHRAGNPSKHIADRDFLKTTIHELLSA